MGKRDREIRMTTTTREYAVCKVCGEPVYREIGSEMWLLGSWDMADLSDVDPDTLPKVACGCND